MADDTPNELRVIRADERDCGTAQTPGMDRQAGVSKSTSGAERLWMGHVTVGPGVRSGAHHHGHLESGIYVISGRARFRYGDRLQHSVEAGPGDFVFVPPHLVHEEMNLSGDDPVVMVVARDQQEGLVVNVEVREA
jgi:uncharacterized RmlC-like cupin family protein